MRIVICTLWLFWNPFATGFVSPVRIRRHHDISRELKGTSSTNEEGSIGAAVLNEARDVLGSLSLAVKPLFSPDSSVDAEAIVNVCDELDQLLPLDEDSGFSQRIKQYALSYKRYELLSKLMRHDYDAYVATASFLSPSRIARLDLPNLEDVPFVGTSLTVETTTDENGTPLISDCDLDDIEYKDSLLDKALLSIFRKLVTKNTDGITSDESGITGLLEQGRNFMLKPDQTPEAQHKMVSDTLGGLMTPVLPPFYRIFMSGIVPKLGTDYDGKQFGPWFYAPFLTSFVTPTFFGFLVGPSYPNRRRDGQPGGLVVEKCKFLQQSGCKGLCLHQCKLPAQQFFQDELGLPLTVQPNFVTQECQWSFGQVPLQVEEDKSFPKGCLTGCQSRTLVAEMNGQSNANLCN